MDAKMNKGISTEKQKSDFLFISGCNLDKRIQVSLNQLINRDQDIQRLIHRGTTYFLFRCLLYISIFLFILTFCIAVTVSDQFRSVIESKINWVTILITLGVIIYSLYDLIKRITTLKSVLERARDFLTLRKEKVIPKRPLDLWHHYPASIIDGQIALYTQKILSNHSKTANKTCCLRYTGEPYSSHFLLDSLDVQWESTTGIPWNKRVNRRLQYNKLYRDYAIQSTVGNALEKSDSLKGKVCSEKPTSDCVFGITFASRFFMNFLDKHFAKPSKDNELTNIHRQNKKNNHNNHLIENITVNIQLPCKKDNDNYQLAENILKYFTHPKCFEFSAHDEPCSDYPITMRVKQITVISLADKSKQLLFPDESAKIEPERWFSRSVHSLKEKLLCIEPYHIPVKRLFLKPPKASYKKPWFLDKLSNAEAENLIMLGGAEQNLTLCHLVNRHRWESFSKIGYKIGFSENSFDKAFHANCFNYLLGTERFIYGCHHQGSIDPHSNTVNPHMNHAEIMPIELDGVPIVIILGYHAISTKLAALKYFYMNIESIAENRYPYMKRADDGSGYSKDYQHYHFTYKGGAKIDEEDWEKIKSYLDENNPFDHPSSSLSGMLEKIHVDPSLIVDSSTMISLRK